MLFNKQIITSLALLSVLSLIALSGCRPNVARLDSAEFRDPMIRKAHMKRQEGDKEGAMQCLTRAIDRKPRLAQAHLALGDLYDHYKKDYLLAIYHYQRYLDLRPQTEKRKMIEDMIERAKLGYGATLSGPYATLEARTQVLQKENIKLRNSIRQLRLNLADALKIPPQKTDTDVEPENATIGISDVNQTIEAQIAGTSNDVYYVRKGDTLSKIAGDLYGDHDKWNIIYKANRENIGNAQKIRIGQALIIPR